MITVNKRESCRLCDSRNLDLVIKLKPIPPQELYLDTAEQAQLVERYPVDVYFCNNCSHVQQLDILETDALWQNYTYESGKAKGMVEHFRKFTDHVTETTSYSAHSLVVDIGSNDGTLLQYFKNKDMQVLGVDPAKNLAKQATLNGVPTIANVFNLQVAQSISDKYGKAKIITAFNAFAHADDLSEIARGIYELLDDDGTFYFEVQYLQDLINKVLLGSIFHEHMSHHSVGPMKRFLESHRLTLTDVKHSSVQHGAIIGTVKKTSSDRVLPTVNSFLKSEQCNGLDQKTAINGFNDKLKVLKEKSADFKFNIPANTKVYGYGAARSGQTLISQLGLEGVISYIADDHPAKVGKYPAGDGIEIIPTSRWVEELPEYTIILAWVHVATIIKNNLEYLNKGGQFIVLTPNFEFVNKENYSSILAQYNKGK